MSEDFLLEEWHDVGLKSDGTSKTNDSGFGPESSARLSDVKVETITGSTFNNKSLVPTVRTYNRTKQRTQSSKIGLPLKSNGDLAINSSATMTSSEAAKLLDISSDSSESDLNLEIAPPKRKVRFKRKFRAPSRSNKAKVNNAHESSSCTPCLCSNTFTIFGLLLLTICSLAQIWFHYNLSSRVDGIQKQYNSIEAQSKETPEALHDYHIQLKNLEFNVTTFAEELKKINAEISTINESVRQLKSITSSLKDSIAAAPEIKTLPKDLSSLTESVVNMGSKITQLDSNIKELKSSQSGLKTSAQALQISQDELKGNVSSLMQMKDEISSQKGFISSSESSFKDSLMVHVHKEIQVMRDLIDDFNLTITPKINNFTEWGFQIVEMNDTLNWAMNDLSSLHTFVYSNLTAALRQVQNEGSISDATIEQTVLKTLTDTLHNNPVQNKGDWKYLLQEANKMVNIYVDIANQLLSPSAVPLAVISSNGSALVELLMNTVINNCSLDVAKLNDTVQLLHSQDDQTKTFHTSINQTVYQLVNRMNNFSIQLASISNGYLTSQSSKSDYKSKPDTTAIPISNSTTAKTTTEPATKPVLSPARNLRSKILN